jgi:hypothetical protein
MDTEELEIDLNLTPEQNAEKAVATEFDADYFRETSKVWRQNKNYLGHGMFEYKNKPTDPGITKPVTILRDKKIKRMLVLRSRAIPRIY